MTTTSGRGSLPPHEETLARTLPVRIERMHGDGPRPAAMLYFDQVTDKAIYDAQLRLHDKVWNGRRLFVQTLHR